jgi:hypothetical protein
LLLVLTLPLILVVLEVNDVSLEILRERVRVAGGEGKCDMLVVGEDRLEEPCVVRRLI